MCVYIYIYTNNIDTAFCSTHFWPTHDTCDLVHGWGADVALRSIKVCYQKRFGWVEFPTLLALRNSPPTPRFVFGIHHQNGFQFGSVQWISIGLRSCLEGGIRLEYVGNKISWICLLTPDTWWQACWRGGRTRASLVFQVIEQFLFLQPQLPFCRLRFRP